MSSPIVAVLAQLRNTFIKQSGMVAAMHCMASLAILFYRSMFPHYRAAFVGMTFETELLGVIGFNHTSTETAMGFMAGRAADLSFKDRMVRTFICFDFDLTMTTETDLWFIGLLSPSGMEVMAGIAGHIISLVDT
jgi:hypothetical protein